MTQVTLGRFDKPTPHVNWSSRGLTKGTPPLLPPPYSREQILDHDEVWSGIVAQMRDLRRLNDSMVRLGDPERAQEALEKLTALADRVLYAHRVWERRGRWNRYYRVAGSDLMHTGLTCRSVKPSTIVWLDWKLSGLPRQVVAEHYSLCRHCGRRDTGEITTEIFRDFLSEHYLDPCG